MKRNPFDNLQEPTPPMKNPGFFCRGFIDTHSNLPQYRAADCGQQCQDCTAIITQHHAKKKPHASTKF
jgi:hypothetical protein